MRVEHCSLITAGGTALSTVADGRNPNAVSTRIRIPPPFPDPRREPARSESSRWRAHRRAGQHRQQPARVDVVGRDATEPGTDSDARKDRADDAGERLQADADIGRQQATGQDLENEDGGRGSRDQCDRQPALSGRCTPAVSSTDGSPGLADMLSAAVTGARLGAPGASPTSTGPQVAAQRWNAPQKFTTLLRRLCELGVFVHRFLGNTDMKRVLAAALLDGHGGHRGLGFTDGQRRTRRVTGRRRARRFETSRKRTLQRLHRARQRPGPVLGQPLRHGRTGLGKHRR